MKTFLLKFCCIILAVVMLTGSLAGCGGESASSGTGTGNSGTESQGSASQAPATDNGKPDISKKVEVVMYLAGDASPDSPLVETELNKVMERDLNCTLKIINIPWADWDAKYPLILTAGEKYDLIYASNWTQFADYANKGAFRELDDILEMYAPGILKQLPKEAWEEVKINGKIYGLPSKQSNYNTDALVIRGDLREKLGLAQVTDLDSLEVYMEGVKKNYPDIIPFNASSMDRGMFEPTTPYEYVIDESYFKIVAASYDDLDKGNVDFIPFMPGYDQYIQRLKSWSDRGYLPKGLLTSKILSVESFKKGKSAVAVGNTGAIIEDAITNTLQVNPQWKPEFVELRFKSKAGVHPMPFMADGMAVGRNAENPERALMVCDKIRTDKECYNLLFYGIKDRNYILTADGKRADPPGVTPDKNGYLPGNQGQWGFTIAEMELPSASEWSAKKQVIYPEFDKIATPDKMARFAFNRDSIQSEVAAVTQILQQYNLPLMWGKSKDPAKDLEALKNKMKAAGSDKILTAIKSQMADYFKK